MMTEQQMQQLIRDAADKYGIAPKRLIGYSNEFMDEEWLWLHNDSARCFELMVENSTYLSFDDKRAIAGYLLVDYEYFDFEEFYADHNNDKPLATRIAILRALLSKEVE